MSFPEVREPFYPTLSMNFSLANWTLKVLLYKEKPRGFEVEYMWGPFRWSLQISVKTLLYSPLSYRFPLLQLITKFSVTVRWLNRTIIQCRIFKGMFNGPQNHTLCNFAAMCSDFMCSIFKLKKRGEKLLTSFLLWMRRVSIEKLQLQEIRLLVQNHMPRS